MTRESTIAKADRERSRAYGPSVSCKHCGSTTVFWQATPGGKFELRNTEDHQKHVCPTSADGFGDCKCLT